MFATLGDPVCTNLERHDRTNLPYMLTLTWPCIDFDLTCFDPVSSDDPTWPNLTWHDLNRPGMTLVVPMLPILTRHARFDKTWPHPSWADVSSVDPMLPKLPWFDLTLPDMTFDWSNVTQLDLMYPDMTRLNPTFPSLTRLTWLTCPWSVVTQHDLTTWYDATIFHVTWLDLMWPELIWHDLSGPDMTHLDLSWPDKPRLGQTRPHWRWLDLLQP